MLGHGTHIQIKALIAEDKLETALKLLIAALEGHDTHNSLLIQSGTLHRVKTAFRDTLIDWDKMSQTRVRIGHAILSILEEIEIQYPQLDRSLTEPLPPTSASESFEPLKRTANLKLVGGSIIAVIIVGIAVLWYPLGNTSIFILIGAILLVGLGLGVYVYRRNENKDIYYRQKRKRPATIHKDEMDALEQEQVPRMDDVQPKSVATKQLINQYLQLIATELKEARKTDS